MSASTWISVLTGRRMLSAGLHDNREDCDGASQDEGCGGLGCRMRVGSRSRRHGGRRSPELQGSADRFRGGSGAVDARYWRVQRVDQPGRRDRLDVELQRTRDGATQAHIHFENATNSGPVIVFLCSNLGNGPAGTQACPADGSTISGTITAADVGAGGAAQGLAAGELAELVSSIRAGATYVNVHSVGRPAGEIRAQLGDDHGGHD